MGKHGEDDDLGLLRLSFLGGLLAETVDEDVPQKNIGEIVEGEGPSSLQDFPGTFLHCQDSFSNGI